MNEDTLGGRMKEYEKVSARYLTRRLPVILRVDGKAFHTLLSKCEKPYDPDIIQVMWEVAIAMCEDMQGVKIAYIQSDEISFLLTDYETIETQAWFNNNVSKIESVAAGLASAHFTHRYGKVASFDARAFNLPKEEVTNYFIWRQVDATRNSVQGLARAHFSHKELHGLSGKELATKLFTEAQINWKEFPVFLRRGACITRETYTIETEGGPITRHKWRVDNSIPSFKKERAYIDRFVGDTKVGK